MNKKLFTLLPLLSLAFAGCTPEQAPTSTSVDPWPERQQVSLDEVYTTPVGTLIETEGFITGIYSGVSDDNLKDAALSNGVFIGSGDVGLLLYGTKADQLGSFQVGDKISVIGKLKVYAGLWELEVTYKEGDVYTPYANFKASNNSSLEPVTTLTSTDLAGMNGAKSSLPITLEGTKVSSSRDSYGNEHFKMKVGDNTLDVRADSRYSNLATINALAATENGGAIKVNAFTTYYVKDSTTLSEDKTGFQLCNPTVVEYSNPTISKFEISTADDATSFEVGKELACTAKLTTNDVEYKASLVEWTTSDEDVATVDANGKVFGIKAGDVEITAKSKIDSTKSDTVSLTVTAPVVPLNGVELTAANLLGYTGTNVPYAADETTVDLSEVTFGLKGCGAYGNGIQMRYNNDKTGTSEIYNKTATKKAIKNIVLTHNPDKTAPAKTDYLQFKFGSAFEGEAAETIKVTTNAQTFEYTVTPVSATYTFFDMTLLASGSSYWDSILINYVD